MSGFAYVQLEMAIFILLRAQHPPCPWDEYTCFRAARHGLFHELQWLRSQDPPCPWDEWACVYAAEKGHLHIFNLIYKVSIINYSG